MKLIHKTAEELLRVMLLKPTEHLKYLHLRCKRIGYSDCDPIVFSFLCFTSLTAYRTEVGAIVEGGCSLHTFWIKFLYALANEVLLISLSRSVAKNAISYWVWTTICYEQVIIG